MSYDYEAATGRLTDVRDWLGGDFHYTWNDDGQVETLSFPNGVGTAFDHDPVSAEVTRVRTTNPNELLNVSYTYRAVGEQLVGSEQRVGVPAGGGAATTSSRSYGSDDLGRLSSASITDDGGPAVSGTFGFDAADRIKKVFDGSTLAYDGAGQLATATANGGAVTSFSFDPRGNRTGQATAGSTTTYTYDSADQLTGRSSSWSPTGYTYTYAGTVYGRR